MSEPDDLRDLPFDQYSRHRIVALTAASVRRTHGLDRLRLLDVGGFPCLTPRFVPEDDVVVIDVATAPPPPDAHFVRADGSALPFQNESFDVVVSLDSLEHVPQERREAYLSELLRVARSYVLLIAPFSQPETVLSERLLAEFVRVVNQEEQPQLREHRAFGLPSLDEWRHYLERHGLTHVAFSSGYVYHWLPMMLLKHYVLTVPDSDLLHRTLDRFYNELLGDSDHRLPGYRQGLLISKLGPTTVLGEVSAAMSPTGEADRLEVIERMERIGLLLKLADLHVSSRRDDRLRDELVDKDRHILNLEASVRELQGTLQQLQTSHQEQLAAERVRGDALQAQLSQLQAHLEAIQGGRVMRLLGAVDHLRGPKP